MARLAVVAMAVAVAVAQDEGSGVGLPAGHEDILSKWARHLNHQDLVQG